MNTTTVMGCNFSFESSSLSLLAFPFNTTGEVLFCFSGDLFDFGVEGLLDADFGVISSSLLASLADLLVTTIFIYLLRDGLR